MNKKTKILTLTLVFGYIFTAFGGFNVTTIDKEIENVSEPKIATMSLSTFTYEPIYSVNMDLKEESRDIIEEPIIDDESQGSKEEPIIDDESQEPKEEPFIDDEQVSQEDIELLALLTMAEAEGECDEGKRLVIDTVLNRVDSEHFPDTIYDVIYQPKHFSSIWNGRIDRCEVREDIYQLVIEELESRTNYDVIFFNAGRYSKFGVPMFQVENHYFSRYD